MRNGDRGPPQAGEKWGGLLRISKVKIWKGERQKLDGDVGLEFFGAPILSFIKGRWSKEKADVEVEFTVYEMGDESADRGELPRAIEKILEALGRDNAESDNNALRDGD